jgi:hypothetical protein
MFRSLDVAQCRTAEYHDSTLVEKSQARYPGGRHSDPAAKAAKAIIEELKRIAGEQFGDVISLPLTDLKTENDSVELGASAARMVACYILSGRTAWLVTHHAKPLAEAVVASCMVRSCLSCIGEQLEITTGL